MLGLLQVRSQCGFFGIDADFQPLHPLFDACMFTDEDMSFGFIREFMILCKDLELWHGAHFAVRSTLCLLQAWLFLLFLVPVYRRSDSTDRRALRFSKQDLLKIHKIEK